MDASISDEDYQDRILPHVSRTFALTIPQLPASAAHAVTNAYLLCRIADTIEDEPALSAAATLDLLHRFVAVLCGREDAAPSWRRISLPQLSERTLPAERDLVLNMGRVVRVTETPRGAAAARDPALRRSHVQRACTSSSRPRACAGCPARATWTTTATTWRVSWGRC